MNVYTCNDFTGYWPTGTAAIVMASSKKQAEQMLIDTLEERGLEQESLTMIKISTHLPLVRILCDGNY